MLKNWKRFDGFGFDVFLRVLMNLEGNDCDFGEL